MRVWCSKCNKELDPLPAEIWGKQYSGARYAYRVKGDPHTLCDSADNGFHIRGRVELDTPKSSPSWEQINQAINLA